MKSTKAIPMYKNIFITLDIFMFSNFKKEEPSIDEGEIINLIISIAHECPIGVCEPYR